MPKSPLSVWEVLYFINDSASDSELEPPGSSLKSVAPCKFPKSKEAASVRRVLTLYAFTCVQFFFWPFFFIFFGLYWILVLFFLPVRHEGVQGVLRSRYNHGGFVIKTGHHTYITPWSTIYDLRGNKTASAFIHCYLRA